MMRVRLLILVLSAVACQQDAFGPEEPHLGTNLLPGEWVSSPAFSVDGHEVLFLELAQPSNHPNTGYQLKAVAIESRAVRDVSETVPGVNGGGTAVSVAPDAASAFFSTTATTGGWHMQLFRVPVVGGSAELVVTDMEWPWFTVSADGRRVAYSRLSSDGTQAGVTLVITDLETEEDRTVRSGWDTPGVPFVLSPDGDWLVYRASRPPDTPEIRLFSFESGAFSVIMPGSDSLRVRAWSSDVRWENGTPELIFVQGEAENRFSLNRINGTTGEVTKLGEVPDAEDFPAVAWSRDGTKVALWTPIETLRVGGCDPDIWISRNCVLWRLYLWESPRGWSTIAEVALDEGARWLAFSPSGTSIGYRLYGEIFVESLP